MGGLHYLPTGCVTTCVTILCINFKQIYVAAVKKDITSYASVHRIRRLQYNRAKLPINLQYHCCQRTTTKIGCSVRFFIFKFFLK